MKKRATKSAKKVYSSTDLEQSRTTTEEQQPSPFTKKLILHLKVTNSSIVDDDNAISDYSNMNPRPHEPNTLISGIDSGKLCKYSSSLSLSSSVNIPESIQASSPTSTEQLDTSAGSNVQGENLKENNQMIIVLMSDFIQGVNGKWPEKTNIHCTWDSHAFTNTPCGIPKRYENGVFYLDDCFCSFNCCASFIFSEKSNEKWEQYSLLNLMYQKMYKKSHMHKIDLALPKKMINIFGGYMDIVKYRQNSDTIDKKYNIIMPPMVSIVPHVEILKGNCVINGFNTLDWGIKKTKSREDNILASYLKLK